MKQFNFSPAVRTLLALFLFAALCAGCVPIAPQAASSPNPSSTAALTVSETSELSDTGEFAILFVNVGRADAAILRFGETTVLIDVGSEASIPQLIAGLNLLDVEKIDAVFLTHSHDDHVGGLSALRANYDISIVYSPLFSEKNKDGEGKIVALCEKLDLPHRELIADQRTYVTLRAYLSVLAPLALNEEDDNDNSLVFRLTYNGVTFLFAGDAQFAEEGMLLQSGADLAADVLKVGNHGNSDATSEEFARAVSPRLAIISTNTTEDADSANPRVLAALAPAQTYVTQDFRLGVLFTLGADGAPAISNPAPESDAPRVRIASLDAEKQTITLANDGETSADLSGCLLFCDRSGAALRFPQGTRLDSGESLTVSGESGGGAFVFFDEKKPLSKKKEDVVSLYGVYGALLSSGID